MNYECALRFFRVLVVFLLVGACAHASEQEEEAQDLCLSPFAALPPEVLEFLFSFFDAQDTARANRVCEHWHEILISVHGPVPALSVYLSNPLSAPEASQIPDPLMERALFYRLLKGAFVSVNDALFSPQVDALGSRLLTYTGIDGTTAPLVSWGGSCDPEGQEKDTQDLNILQESAHTFVVRAKYFRTHKEELRVLLTTRNDHRVVLCLDDETFVTHGVLTLSWEDMPQNLRHLILLDPFGRIKAIGNNFLRKDGTLESLHIQALSGVKTIGSSFLYESTFKRVSLEGLTGLARIEDNFLALAEGIENMSTRGLSGVASIGKYAFWECKGLATLGTEGLTGVEEIGDGFLGRCEGVTGFDLAPFKNVKRVGSSFLKGTNLTQEEERKVEAFLARINERGR